MSSSSSADSPGVPEPPVDIVVPAAEAAAPVPIAPASPVVAEAALPVTLPDTTPATPPPFAPPPPPLAPPPPPPPPLRAGIEVPRTAHPLRFHGRTDEYFRIWIVNTLLTILTLGIFFAWAKVRKRRYLRGSTELLGHRFDYRANPARLLFGHLVVLVLFLGYSVFGVVYPGVRWGVLGLAALLLPWIVVRSMTFNAHNTVYRGLRFRFNRSLSAAAKVYLLEPVLIVLTLGIYYPAWQRSKRGYAISNHRYGDAYFQFSGGVGEFFLTYLCAGLILAAAVFFGGVLMAVVLTTTKVARPNLVQMLPFFAFYGLGFFISRHLIYARLFNHAWNHTRIDDHRFRAELDWARWLGLQLTNLGAIVISAGLLYPWAVIRAQRYAASCLQFEPAGSIDSIQRLGGASGSATGDMAAEFIGLDFGL